MLSKGGGRGNATGVIRLINSHSELNSAESNELINTQSYLEYTFFTIKFELNYKKRNLFKH